MARYEDTATPFAEAQFAGVRERKQQEAKKQEKFAKKLAVVQTVAKGANALINSRADALEANQTHVKAAYANHIGKADKIRELESEINKSGRTATDFFKDGYYTTLLAQAKAESDELGLKFIEGNFTYLNNKAYEMAEKKAEAFKKSAIEANDLPTLEDFKTNWDTHSKLQAPRSIFGAFTKAAKGFFKKETPETLAYKEGKAKDALFNTPLKKEFADFETIYKTYDALGFDATPILDEVRKMDKRKAVSERQRYTEKSSIDLTDGTYTTNTYERIIYADGTAETIKLSVGGKEIADNLAVDPTVLYTWMETVQPELRASLYEDIKGKAVITTNDFIDLQVRRTLEDGKLSSVDDWQKASKELRDGYESVLTGYVLTPELMKKYNLTAAGGHTAYTPLFEDIVELSSKKAAPTKEYGYILHAEGLIPGSTIMTEQQYVDRGLEKLNIKLVKNAGIVRVNFDEFKDYVATDYKYLPEDFEGIENDAENPLNILAKTNPNSNGVQTITVPNVSAYFPTDFKAPTSKGTIKRNALTGEVFYKLANDQTTGNTIKPVNGQSTGITFYTGATVPPDNIDLVATKFKLDPEIITEIITSATNKGSLINNARNNIEDISRQQLIDLGYIDSNAPTPAPLARKYQNQMARNKLILDLAQDLTNISEDTKTYTASL